MKKIQYGRTNLRVSQLCLGTGRIGYLSDRASAFEVLDTYVEQGGNFIQATSHAYLPSLECNPEKSESLVGEWLNANSNCREELVVCARIRCPQGASGLELEHSIRAQIELSLKRLGARYLDIVLLDWSTGFFPTYEVMSVLERLSDRGLLRYVGSVGFPCWRIAEWLGRGAQPSRMRLESAHLDGPFTQCCLEELSREHRVSLVVRWPFTDGYEPLFSTARQVFGRTSFQVGMAWLFSKESICSILFSPKLKSQLDSAIEASRASLSSEELSRIEAAYMNCALPPHCPMSGEFLKGDDSAAEAQGGGGLRVC
ncbi:aldo/keto reductase [Pelagicoccus enzymogenes]|uniref:aldo/keto reductase n=1 Tax=Pelagicoccus enzymogenes TaxID=2773457 RepID=UPI0028101C53|nr:aldo/keto reductase [Pelagicoccus enzymogenes]MDQ8200294.1 aldo/keto reductase [Pelagicoccus enzymogenes]